MNFKKILSYSALESIGSRVFDFVTLWIVLNAFNTDDVAKFGVATSVIFIFNLFLITPETSLLKFQKKWASESVLTKYLSAFVSFSFFKISLHYIAASVIYFYSGEFNWLFYAVVFSGIIQQIQAAEIARIIMRMDLQQRQVARFEIVSKFILMLVCLVLFIESSIEVYFLIYVVWSIVVTILWLYVLYKKVKFNLIFNKESFGLVWSAMLGFSFWTHISGVMSLYIYNGSLIFLSWMDTDIQKIAVYTVVNKVVNLFFVIPMFFQSFVPVLLANTGDNENSQFNRLLLVSGGLSLVQFLFFVLFGGWLGDFFGLEGDAALSEFYQFGLIVSLGILIFNLSRPLGTYILINGSPSNLMLRVFFPSCVLASIAYPVAINFYGSFGAAAASAFIYFFLSLMIVLSYRKLSGIAK
jgi:O-antigen/teichoic acid export membrane protein